MKPLVRLSLLGVASYLLLLVLLAPAAKVLPWIEPYLEDVEFFGPQGSVWFGQAALVQSDQLRMHDIHWDWQPLALFTGNLEFSLSASIDGQRIQAKAGSSVLGNSYLANVQGLLSADELLYWLDIRGTEVQGMLDLALERVQWGSGFMPQFSGRISWSPAMVVQPVALSLGVVHVLMQASDEGTAGTLEAKNGILQANGEFVFSNDGNYRIQADVKKNGTVPQAVVAFLDTFTDFRNGAYKLEWSDSL